MKKCPHCAEEIQDEAKVCRFCNRAVVEQVHGAIACPHCGHVQRPGPSQCERCQKPMRGAATAPTLAPVVQGWNPGVAAVLSFFIPGLGQLYKGRLGRGAAFFCGTLAGLFLLVFPAIIIWIWNIVDAYNGPGGKG